MSDIEVSDKKVKKAKISATYEKLQAYVFNIAQQNLNNNTIDEETFKKILDNVKIFDSVEDQTTYFNETCSNDGWKILIKSMKEYRKITIKANNPTPVKKQTKKSPKKEEKIEIVPSDNEEIVPSDNEEIISSDNEETDLITSSVKDEIVHSDNEEKVVEVVEIVSSVKEETTDKSAKKKSNKKGKKSSEEEVINVAPPEKEEVINVVPPEKEEDIKVVPTEKEASPEKSGKKKSNKKK